MKSMLAKHAPQSSPWAPTRARQDMQTGGKMRSAAALRIYLASGCRAGRAATSSTNSASPIAMGPMIERPCPGREDGVRRGAS